jgi:glycosyltransferase involved in cell wall biosynthesis
MNSETISVLMSVYHAEHPGYLEASLESISNQTLLPSEIVLVIDGQIPHSLVRTIDTFQVSLKRRGITLKTPRNPHNMGLAISLNRGLKHCSNSIIARMDTDDICRPERLLEQHKLIQKGANFVYTSSLEFEKEPGDNNTMNLAASPSRVKKALGFRNPIVHPTVMFRKDFIDSLGAYRKLDFFEDYDLWIRVFESASAQIAHIEVPLVYFRTSRQHRSRRSGLTYFRYGLQAKVKWMQENRNNPFYIVLSLAPFFIFSVAPIWAKEALYKLLRN